MREWREGKGGVSRRGKGGAGNVRAEKWNEDEEIRGVIIKAGGRQ